MKKHFYNFALSTLTFLSTLLFPNLVGTLLAQPSADCTGTPDFSVPANTTVNISTWFPSTSAATGKLIALGNNSTLVINKDFSLQGCRIRCGSGATISVAASSPLTFKGIYSRFYTCSTLTQWNGITVNNGHAVIMINSIISRANNGITFPAGYAVSSTLSNAMRNTVFENNNIGIFITGDPFGTATSTVTFAYCYGNRFTSGNFGIRVRLGTLNFGTAGTVNEFTSLLRGVTMNNSTLTITNSHFHDMFAVSNPNVGDATGIFAASSTLTVTSLAGGFNCRFNDNDTSGVMVFNAAGATVIENAEFSGEQDHGITYRVTGNAVPVTIQDNEFTLVRSNLHGIDLDRPSGASAATNSFIDHNTFQVDAPANANAASTLRSIIYVYGGNDASNDMDITFNTIDNNEIRNTAHGIYVAGGGDNYHVNYNKVRYLGDVSHIDDISPERPVLGIAFDHASGVDNEIVGNYVRSQLEDENEDEMLNTYSYIKCGIHVDASNAPEICANDVDSTYRAFHFNHDNGQAVVSINTSENHVYGMYFDAGTDIGNQVRTRNVWSIAANDYIDGGRGAFHGNTHPPFKFYIDSSEPASHIPPSANPVIINWFQVEDGDPTGCGGRRLPSKGELLVATGEHDYFDAAQRWDLERRLWYSLLHYPEWQEEYEEMADFYTETYGSSPYKFAMAQRQFEEAFLYEGASAATLDSLYKRHSSLTAGLLALNVEIGGDTTAVDATDWSSLAGKMADLTTTNQGIFSWQAAHLSDVEDALDALQIQVDALPADSAYESSWIAMLTADIQRSLTGTVDSLLRIQLVSVAESCPEEVGEAQQAVINYMSPDDAAPYLGREKTDGCERAAQHNHSRQAMICVAPNPTSGRLLVKGPFQDCTWQMINIYGQTLLSGKTAMGQQDLVIDVSFLPSATYVLRVVSTTGESAQTKISILR